MLWLLFDTKNQKQNNSASTKYISITKGIDCSLFTSLEYKMNHVMIVIKT